MQTSRILAGAAVAACLALTGCSTPDSTDATPTDTAVPTPSSITRPEAREDCTVGIDRDAGEGDYPDRATVTCGQHAATVAGDFGNRVTNSYGEDGNVAKLVVVGQEARAWVHDGEGTCLVRYQLDGPPVKCEASGQGADSAPSPSDGHTVVPEDQAGKSA